MITIVSGLLPSLIVSPAFFRSQVESLGRIIEGDFEAILSLPLTLLFLDRISHMINLLLLHSACKSLHIADLTVIMWC